MIETKVMLGPNPAADLKWFQGRKREAQTSGNVPFFTVEEMPKVLDAFRALHPRWYPFVLTSFLGGLRFGEIAALHRDDLDVKRGLLTVEWAISGGKVAPTKTSKVRHVKVSPALLKAITWRRWRSTPRRVTGPLSTHGSRSRSIRTGSISSAVPMIMWSRHSTSW